MARTKILATIGPASFGKIDELVEAGLDGMRFNMSHVRDYDATAKLILEARERHPSIFTIADLEGPKIRLGNLREPLAIQKGAEIALCLQAAYDSKQDPFLVPIQLETLCNHVKPGNTLLINDGASGLTVTGTDKTKSLILATVEYGDKLESRKGVNVPGVSVPTPFIEDKDARHIEFLKRIGVDYVSASYARNASDISQLRQALGDSRARIIAKIENHEGIENFEGLLNKSDAIMVARGDLGMEIGVVNVPAHQKQMILKCNVAGKPVITATQMMESMMQVLEPKRAEVSDIFNAVLDGTDVVMLSGETSVGQYPVETVKMMNRTIEEAEKYVFTPGNGVDLASRLRMDGLLVNDAAADTISHAVASAARDTHIRAIIAPTSTGYTAQMISRFRTGTPIIAVTNNPSVYRQLGMVWGVTAVLDEKAGIEDIERWALGYGIDSGIVRAQDRIIITSGLTRYSDRTNSLRIVTA